MCVYIHIWCNLHIYKTYFCYSIWYTHCIVYIYIDTCMYTCICVYIFLHIHIYIYIYTLWIQYHLSLRSCWTCAQHFHLKRPLSAISVQEWERERYFKGRIRAPPGGGWLMIKGGSTVWPGYTLVFMIHLYYIISYYWIYIYTYIICIIHSMFHTLYVLD